VKQIFSKRSNKKGKAVYDCPAFDLDHITAAPITKGRRAELPPAVAMWMVRPFAVPGGLFLDPFAGSGALLQAAEDCGMHAEGYERATADTKNAA
jgi:hypothetical protein